jgi:hypothetical protein
VPPRQVFADYRIVGRESTGFTEPVETDVAVSIEEI